MLQGEFHSYMHNIYDIYIYIYYTNILYYLPNDYKNNNNTG